MTLLPAALDGPVFRRLAWTLLQFVWQGAVVASILAALEFFVRPKRAAVRYVLACAALAAMLVWTLATFAGKIPDGPVVERGGYATAAGAAGEAAARVARPPETVPAAARDAFASAEPVIAALWMSGVLFLSLRFLVDWLSVERLRRRHLLPAPGAFRAALDRLAARLGILRPVRLAESAAVKVPMAVGIVKPIILFPIRCLAGLSPEEIEAVLAHELAHVRRHDYLVNLVQTFAETLLFYHPAVWWVSYRIRAERENCCDDDAVAATGNAGVYARALVGLEELRGSPSEPAMAATGGALWKRIARLVPAAPHRDGASGWIAGLLALAAVWGLGAIAQLSDAEPSDDPVVAEAHRAPSASRSTTPRPSHRRRSDAESAPTPSAASDSASAVTSPEPAAAPVAAGPVVAGSPAPQPSAADPAAASPAPEAPTATATAEPVAAAPPEAAEPATAPEARPAAAETGDAPTPSGRLLSPEQLVALRMHGVTPEFVRELAAAGFDRLSAGTVLALKIHGVTPEFVHEMTGLLGKQTPDACLALRIHGVTSDFLRGFHAAGYDHLSADEALTLRIHGVSPADAQAWTSLGFGHLSLDDLLALRIHGVDPSFASAMRSEGFPQAGTNQLLAFRIHGVTPDFVREFRALGYQLSADDATSLRIHGVTPELARKIRAIGYKSASADDLIALRIHGVTPEDIRKKNGASGTLIPLDELIEMRTHRRKGD